MSSGELWTVYTHHHTSPEVHFPPHIGGQSIGRNISIIILIFGIFKKIMAVITHSSFSLILLPIREGNLSQQSYQSVKLRGPKALVFLGSHIKIEVWLWYLSINCKFTIIQYPILILIPTYNSKIFISLFSFSFHSHSFYFHSLASSFQNISLDLLEVL